MNDIKSKIQVIRKQIQEYMQGDKIDLSVDKNRIVLVVFDGCSYCYDSILCLLDNSFIPEAGANIRLLLEAYVDLVLILQDKTNERAKMFLEFQVASATELNNAVAQNNEKLLSKKTNWLDKGVKAKINMIESEDEKTSTYFAFKYLCQHSHPSYPHLGSRFLLDPKDFQSRKITLIKMRDSFDIISANLIVAIYYVVSSYFNFQDLKSASYEIKNELIIEASHIC